MLKPIYWLLWPPTCHFSSTWYLMGSRSGTPNSNLNGGLASIFQLVGGNIAPQFQIIGEGAKVWKSQHIYCLGGKFFPNPYNSRFLNVLRRVFEKFFESPKIDFYCIVKLQFFDILPKIFQNASNPKLLGDKFWRSVVSF